MDNNQLDQRQISEVVQHIGNEHAAKQYETPCKVIAVPNVLVGVEIELEQWRATMQVEDAISNAAWIIHDEGSLRNGREYVLYPPQNGAGLERSINTFFDSKHAYDPSERASVHVHVDASKDFTVGNFRAMLALTYIIEGAIYRVADENRKWASYSCPLTDMRSSRFNAMLGAKGAGDFFNSLVGKYHEEKYYGFNAVSLSKHGTIEFRYFPCTRNKDDVYKWINICLELRKVSTAFDNTVQLLDAMDKLGPINFVKQYMPASYNSLLVYLDPNDTVTRAKLVRAIVTDDNCDKPVTMYRAGHIPESKAIAKLLARAEAMLESRNRAPDDQGLVELSVQELYDNLLAQLEIK